MPHSLSLPVTLDTNMAHGYFLLAVFGSLTPMPSSFILASKSAIRSDGGSIPNDTNIGPHQGRWRYALLRHGILCKILENFPEGWGGDGAGRMSGVGTLGGYLFTYRYIGQTCHSSPKRPARNHSNTVRNNTMQVISPKLVINHIVRSLHKPITLPCLQLCK
jgi:hypothetical protein